MVTNEVQEIKVDFKPAIISIEEREQFEQYVNQVVATYKGYVVSAETLKDDKKIRANLNNLIKQIDDQRKEVKREFNKPLDEFQSWVKKATEPLNNTIASIDMSIKELENHEKNVRMEVIRAELSELTKGTEIDPRIFESYLEDWAKAGNFTKDYKIKKILMDALKFVIDREQQIQAEFKENAQTISSFAFDNNLPDGSYLRMLDEKRTLSDILQVMREDIAKAKEQRERAEMERQELANRQLEKDFGLEEEQPQTPEAMLGIRFAGDVNSSVAFTGATDIKHEQKPQTDSAYPAMLTIGIVLESEAQKEVFKQMLVDYGFKHYQVKSFTKM